MPKKSLRSQLNQIRAWVQQGRTDAWIAHQLEIPAGELREFRRRHKLAPEEGEPGEVDLRDEIEAEIEAATLAAEEEEAELDEEEEEELDEEPGAREARVAAPGGEEAEAVAGAEPSEAGEEAPRRRRRRRRRGGRGRGRGRRALEATFDHGEADGYGLRLDPAVADNPVYAEHWRGQRAVRVEIEPDRITIRRAEEPEQSERPEQSEQSER